MEKANNIYCIKVHTALYTQVRYTDAEHLEYALAKAEATAPDYHKVEVYEVVFNSDGIFTEGNRITNISKLIEKISDIF